MDTMTHSPSTSIRSSHPPSPHLPPSAPSPNQPQILPPQAQAKTETPPPRRPSPAGAVKQEQQATEVSTPPPNAPGTKTQALAAGGSGAKSRKSSCDLCHHRKIKCDQLRPSCSSCTRKGHPCHYPEETDSHPPLHPLSRSTSRAQTVTIVSATNPGEKTTITVPLPSWNSSGSAPGAMGPGSRDGSASVGGGSANGGEKDKKTERVQGGSKSMPAAGSSRRERIVNGFDSSDEEEEVEGGAAGPKMVDGAEGEEEVDELEESEQGDGRGMSIASSSRRRSEEDDVSGELLELATADPLPKKKKPRPSAPMPVFQPSRPLAAAPSRSQPRHHPHSHHGPRQSLPASLSHHPFPPTPSTGGTFGLGISHASAAAVVSRIDPYTTPLSSLLASLPSPETQQILFTTFFADPLFTEGISLLQPQFLDDFRGLSSRRGAVMRDGDATCLASAFAFLAAALSILPDETGKLLLAQAQVPSQAGGVAQPRSFPRIMATLPASLNDPTPLDQRYFDLALLAAQVAEQNDAPSVMLVMLKLVLYRYCIGLGRHKLVLAGGYLAQAIKVAQALGMGKEWEGLPQGERELRRRVMWTLYVADRQQSFDTSFPYTILDAHQGIHLPSPMAEAELYRIPPDQASLPPHDTQTGPTPATSLFIHTHLSRRLTQILDSFATVGPTATPHELVLRFDASLDSFQDALPPYLRLFPQTDTRYDANAPYLPAHRAKLHASLLLYRQGVHRNHLLTYLAPASPAPYRGVIAQISLACLRIHRSAKLLDPKVVGRVFNPQAVFESAATLAMILHVEKCMYARGADMLAMRGGLAEGLELLDMLVGAGNAAAGAGLGDGGVFARRAVGTLRELMGKVDRTYPSRPSPEPAPIFTRKPLFDGEGTESPDKAAAAGVSEQMGERTDSAGTAAANEEARKASETRVNEWIEMMRREGTNMEFLMREGGGGVWERVLAGM